MGGVYPARKQDSSVGGGAGVICLGVVHMEEGVQVRLQVEVGREGEGYKERHTERVRTKEQRGTKRAAAHHGWHGDGMTHACRHLSP